MPSCAECPLTAHISQSMMSARPTCRHRGCGAGATARGSAGARRTATPAVPRDRRCVCVCVRARARVRVVVREHNTAARVVARDAHTTATSPRSEAGAANSMRPLHTWRPQLLARNPHAGVLTARTTPRPRAHTNDPMCVIAAALVRHPSMGAHPVPLLTRNATTHRVRPSSPMRWQTLARPSSCAVVAANAPHAGTPRG